MVSRTYRYTCLRRINVPAVVPAPARRSMTAIMGTMSEPVRGKSAVGFPSALLAFLSFEGCLSFGLASPPPGWSSGFVSRSFRPSNAVLRSVAALETRPFCSLLNVVLFHSERACSYASVRDATVSSVYLRIRQAWPVPPRSELRARSCRVRSDHHTWPDILGWSVWRADRTSWSRGER